MRMSTFRFGGGHKRSDSYFARMASFNIVERQIMQKCVDDFNQSTLKDCNTFYPKDGCPHGETRHRRIGMYYRDLLKVEIPTPEAPAQSFTYKEDEFPALCKSQGEKTFKAVPNFSKFSNPSFDLKRGDFPELSIEGQSETRQKTHLSLKAISDTLLS